jgi:Tfp pilus assembly protein PilO
MVTLSCAYIAVNLGLRQRGQIRQEEERVMKASKDLTLAESALAQLQASLSAAKKRLGLLDERIPEAVEIGEFVKKIDLLTKERQIALISVQPLPRVNEALYTRIPVRLSFEGSFNRVYHFVREVELMSPVVLLENLTMSRSGEFDECHVNLLASVLEK